MGKFAVVACALLFAGPALVSQEKKEAPRESPPNVFQIPPEEAKRANPIKPSEESIAEGKRLYSSQCAMCHGTDGDGKGELVEPMKLKLLDYRDPAALKGMTDGEMFYILAQGKGKMPGEGDRLKTDQRWNLINYIRSLARKPSVEKQKETPKP